MQCKKICPFQLQPKLAIAGFRQRQREALQRWILECGDDHMGDDVDKSAYNFFFKNKTRAPMNWFKKIRFPGRGTINFEIYDCVAVSQRYVNSFNGQDTHYVFKCICGAYHDVKEYIGKTTTQIAFRVYRTNIGCYYNAYNADANVFVNDYFNVFFDYQKLEIKTSKPPARFTTPTAKIVFDTTAFTEQLRLLKLWHDRMIKPIDNCIKYLQRPPTTQPTQPVEEKLQKFQHWSSVAICFVMEKVATQYMYSYVLGTDEEIVQIRRLANWDMDYDLRNSLDGIYLVAPTGQLIFDDSSRLLKDEQDAYRCAYEFGKNYGKLRLEDFPCDVNDILDEKYEPFDATTVEKEADDNLVEMLENTSMENSATTSAVAAAADEAFCLNIESVATSQMPQEFEQRQHELWEAMKKAERITEKWYHDTQAAKRQASSHISDVNDILV